MMRYTDVLKRLQGMEKHASVHKVGKPYYGSDGWTNNSYGTPDTRMSKINDLTKQYMDQGLDEYWALSLASNTVDLDYARTHTNPSMGQSAYGYNINNLQEQRNKLLDKIQKANPTWWPEEQTSNTQASQAKPRRTYLQSLKDFSQQLGSSNGAPSGNMPQTTANTPAKPVQQPWNPAPVSQAPSSVPSSTMAQQPKQPKQPPNPTQKPSTQSSDPNMATLDAIDKRLKADKTDAFKGFSSQREMTDWFSRELAKMRG